MADARCVEIVFKLDVDKSSLQFLIQFIINIICFVVIFWVFKFYEFFVGKQKWIDVLPSFQVFILLTSSCWFRVLLTFMHTINFLGISFGLVEYLSWNYFVDLFGNGILFVLLLTVIVLYTFVFVLPLCFSSHFSCIGFLLQNVLIWLCRQLDFFTLY